MATTVTLKPNAIDISGSTSGTTTLQATAVAGTTTITLPAATDTLVGKATTDTLTNKTLTGAVMNGTVGATTPSTGSFTSIDYSTTLTGGTGIVNLGSGQFYKDASGNVGIGTSSPSVKLDVQGNNPTIKVLATNLSGSTSSLELWGSAAGSNYKSAAIQGINYGQLNFQTPSGVGVNSFITLATSATERMRIDSSGNVGIGTSSPTSFGTGYTGTTISAVNGAILQAKGVNNSVDFRFQADSLGLLDVNSNHAMAFRTNATERMRISSTGGLSVGTTSDPGAGAIYATGNITAFFSDDRLKTKLGNIQDALAKVKTLSGFYYEPNQTAQDLGYEAIREVGVSAQQVQAIMPEVVAPAPIDDKYLTVRYEKLIPLLIEAIKELDAKIEGLVKA